MRTLPLRSDFSLDSEQLTTPRRREMEMTTVTVDTRASAWVVRFEVLLRESMPHVRQAAPELCEDDLIQHASRLVESRLAARGVR